MRMRRSPTNNTLRFLPILGLLVVIAGVIMACGSSSDNAGSTTSGSTSSSSSSAKHFKVGDQVKVGDTWVVTVNSAQKHAATDMDQPKSGDTYLVVNVTLKNVSTSEQNLSSLLQFSLKDASGQSYTETITTFAKQPPDGKVEAGSVSSGDMVFEIPTAQKSYTLAFQSDVVSGGETIWDISL